MSGPAKLSENTKIIRRVPSLTDDFYFATPVTGIGGVSVISNLLSLLTGVAPVSSYADEAELLANTTIGIGYFAFVADGEDITGEAGWAVMLYLGSDRSNIASYILIAMEAGGGSSSFLGVYADLTALETAHPTADPGDYALVDVAAAEAMLYIWDDTDSEWVASGVTTIVPDASDTVKGIIEIATDAEVQTGTDTVRAVVPSSLTAWWTWIKTQVQTFAAQITFTSAPILSSTTASQYLKTNGSKEVVSISLATLLSELGISYTPTTVSVSSGTMTLNAALKELAFFEDLTTQSSNFTIAFSNTTGNRLIEVDLRITGTLTLTLPSVVVMEEDTYNWNNGSKLITLYGGTASLFTLSFKKNGATLYELRATKKIFTS